MTDAPPKKLFFVLKFGKKIYLQMTEDQLRAEIAKTKEGTGVRFKDRALVFEVFEVDSPPPPPAS